MVPIFKNAGGTQTKGLWATSMASPIANTHSGIIYPEPLSIASTHNYFWLGPQQQFRFEGSGCRAVVHWRKPACRKRDHDLAIRQDPHNLREGRANRRRESWPNELVLTSHFRLFHVAYDGLPTVIDVDVLDANVLLPTVTKPSKHFDLGRIGSQ